MNQAEEFVLTCPRGIEGLLLDEARELGLADAGEHPAAVGGRGSLETGYRLCLWSRLANRVLLVLARFPVTDVAALYDGVHAIDWHEHLEPDGSLAVEFSGRGAGIDNTHFGALKVKDAIVDRLRTDSGQRPSVDKQHPDLRVHLRLHRGEATLSLDLSGNSLHQRGYRLQQGVAPLKENLAAAILVRAGWPQLAEQGMALADPMCGVATLLIEAGMMATDMAPNLWREHWGFSNWLGHVPATWSRLLAEAEERSRAGLARPRLWIRGYETDPRLMQPARANISRAGLDDWINVYQGEIRDFAPRPDRGQAGLVVCNPPYGERLGEEAGLLHLYQTLGGRLRENCRGWKAAIFTGAPELGRHMGIRSHRQYAFWNGALPCKLLLMDIEPDRFVSGIGKSANGGTGAPAPALSEGGRMFANRLQKNLRQLRKWAKREEITCYRVYDADMPEYAVAVDLYGDWVHVQEYAAPRSVDPDKARARLLDALAAIPEVLGVPPDQVVCKRREKQSGKQQYQRQGEEGRFMEVTEDGARLLVNLTDYLDTGLFLDHRPMRRRVRNEAAGKRFLNLYCYTGAVTVHAALGGARSTTSVDLSNTYLDWARRNLQLNGYADGHRLERADVLDWLEAERGEYDLVFVDPPTFSNSKRMDDVFDVQRDHVRLVDLAMARLAPGGVLYFSNNFRRFKLAPELAERYRVEEISTDSLDPDFARNPKIHRVWRIQAAVDTD